MRMCSIRQILGYFLIIGAIAFAFMIDDFDRIHNPRYFEVQFIGTDAFRGGFSIKNDNASRVYGDSIMPNVLFEQVVSFSKHDPSTKIYITGNSGKSDVDGQAFQLGMDRANFIADTLEDKGLSRKQMIIKSEGSNVPLKRLPSENDWNYNARLARVEVIVRR